MSVRTTTILSQFVLILHNTIGHQLKLDSIILRQRSIDPEYEQKWRTKNLGSRQIRHPSATTAATEYVAVFGFVASNPLVALLLPSISFRESIREKQPMTPVVLQKRQNENAIAEESGDDGTAAADAANTIMTNAENATHLSNDDRNNRFQVIETHDRRIIANNSTSNGHHQINNITTSPLIEYLPTITTPFLDNLAHNVIAELQQHVQLIKPGTKWCGDGNKARSYEDVGVLYRTDKCCRTHDKCPTYILSQETKYGLHNEALWTRSHCDCDTNFYDCLKSVNSPFSTGVGITYFNILKMKCFRYEHPVLMCTQMSGWFSKQCVEYVVDTSKPKLWQWFDNREF